MRLVLLEMELAVCRLSPEEEVPAWAMRRIGFFSITATEDELSLVCAADNVPAGVRCERGWRALKVIGPLDFSLIGIMSSLSDTLARAQVSIFAVSTFDTDYILLKEAQLAQASAALQQAGHELLRS
ncbi:ACT domain-containing protein [Dictyobacter aurantiacus]|uniref:Amino acid-binding protein n=1 Tax=Dictyobacter aurantiacus TaxID=1936993 RepID=A0A401ZIK6_9CHLR|nr:ACT domain-containing protein [Dictyobacter aurantiacus]GCE06682.1 amino acid-binding protein [Dictyobacter aurantiacus]